MIIHDTVLNEHDMNDSKELYKYKGRHYKRLKGGESGWSIPIIQEEDKTSDSIKYELDEEYTAFLKIYRPLYM